MASIVSRAVCLLAVLSLVPVAAASLIRMPAAADVPFVTLADGSFHGPALGRLIVIRTPERWAHVWAVMNAGSVPLPPVPDVDFTQSMILIAARGYKPACGYHARIERIEATDHGLEVTVRKWRETCVTPIVTYWSHVVVVPRNDGRVKAVIVRGAPEARVRSFVTRSHLLRLAGRFAGALRALTPN